jgi:heat shock protein HslJ
MVDEVQKVDRLGMDAIYDTMMSCSLIEDVKKQAAVYRALRSTLEWSCRAPDDPLATEVDRLIHTLDGNRR